MGEIRIGIPKDYIKEVLDFQKIGNFVETGTHRAETSLWAAGLFENVFTIEAYEPLYKESSEKYSHVKNIKFVFGDSKNTLPGIISKLNGPALFWLDAHYSGEGTYGESEKCPLLKELDILNRSEYDNIILIDDARVFLSPPTISHKPEEWPNITDIIRLLNAKKEKYIIILEDVIFAVPPGYMDITAKYAQRINSVNTIVNNTSAKGLMKKALSRLLKRKQK